MTNEKQAAISAIQRINAVEGFDPAPLAVEYTDFNDNEKRQRLPVMAQIAWFRLKYPEGRISVSVVPAKDCFVATARIYPHYNDGPDHFLAEATASRGKLPDKPTVSPREWAQTAAVGIALRNAGFGLQFSAAGDAFDSPAVDELGGIIWSSNEETGDVHFDTAAQQSSMGTYSTPVTAPAPVPQPQEDPLTRAMKMPCPITKYSGKSLGDVMQMDQKAIVWVATKFTGDPEVAAAAKLICEQAMMENA